MPELDLTAARVAISKARDHIDAICLGETRWTMHIPADPERDSDLILSAGLESGEKAITELEQLRADLARKNSVPELRRKPS